jgi:hypothetical protein
MGDNCAIRIKYETVAGHLQRYKVIEMHVHETYIYKGVSKSFQTESIMKSTTTTTNTH